VYCITYVYIFLWVYVVNPYVPDRVYSLWIHLVLYLIGYSLKVSEGEDHVIIMGGIKL